MHVLVGLSSATLLQPRSLHCLMTAACAQVLHSTKALASYGVAKGSLLELLPFSPPHSPAVAAPPSLSPSLSSPEHGLVSVPMFCHVSGSHPHGWLRALLLWRLGSCP